MRHRSLCLLLLAPLAACSPQAPVSTSGTPVPPGTVTKASPSEASSATPGASAAPAQAHGTAFTPGLVQLKVNGAAVTLPASGLVLTADQANGLTMQVGVDANGQIKDNFYQVDVALTGLKKAPTAADFALGDIGRKALTVETLLDGQRTVYTADDSSSISAFLQAGKLDISYLGKASKTSGPASSAASVLLDVTLKTLPTSK